VTWLVCGWLVVMPAPETPFVAVPGEAPVRVECPATATSGNGSPDQVFNLAQ
jgi:hypothetical protein